MLIVDRPFLKPQFRGDRLPQLKSAGNGLTSQKLYLLYSAHTAAACMMWVTRGSLTLEKRPRRFPLRKNSIEDADKDKDSKPRLILKDQLQDFTWDLSRPVTFLSLSGLMEDSKSSERCIPYHTNLNFRPSE